MVPDPVRKQVEDGRTNADFVVSLLCGHVLVAVAAAVDLVAGRAGLAWVTGGRWRARWCRRSSATGSPWSPRTSGPALPARLADEREMWRAAVDFVGRGPTDALDPYRAKPQ